MIVKSYNRIYSYLVLTVVNELRFLINGHVQRSPETSQYANGTQTVGCSFIVHNSLLPNKSHGDEYTM
jgi:hypothetical protein